MKAGPDRTNDRETDLPRSHDSPPRGIHTTRAPHGGLCIVLILAVYAAGLTRGLEQPWVGLHDWNGAFFSQLARNLLRYPISVHHGMGVVAVGDAVPPPEERSMYAAHPPALIWLVALAFRILGEAEWVARLVPILASLGTLLLLVWLVERSRGSETAILAGLIYAVSPMAVYFGRMVDHEALCALLMLAALACWQIVIADSTLGRRSRLLARTGCIAALCGGIWMDWFGVLFAGLFCIHVLLRLRRRKISRGLAFTILAVSLLSTAVMLVHLVYGGLEGRFTDVIAIFISRAANPKVEEVHKGFFAPEGPWRHVLGNLTWPTVLLASAGLIRAIIRVFSRRRPAAQRAAKIVTLPSTNGWWVLVAAGVLWLCLLWRQFERHNYWMFYLAPPIALWTAEALLAMRDRLRTGGRRLASGVFYTAVAVVVLAALRGTDTYFAIVSYPNEAVFAWRQIKAGCAPNQRVLLYLDPVLPEVRGQYLLRNIRPTQQTYYLDHPFEVEKDFAAVIEKAPAYCAYVVPISVALAHAGELEILESRFPRRVLGLGGPHEGYAVVVFNLASGESGPH